MYSIWLLEVQHTTPAHCGQFRRAPPSRIASWVHPGDAQSRRIEGHSLPTRSTASVTVVPWGSHPRVSRYSVKFRCQVPVPVNETRP